MPKTTTTTASKKKTNEPLERRVISWSRAASPGSASASRAASPKRASLPLNGKLPVAVVTTGCPSGVGSELAVRLLATTKKAIVVVGDRGALLDAASRLGFDARLVTGLGAYEGELRSGSCLAEVGEPLARSERVPGKPSKAGGRAQLAFVERGFEIAKRHGLPLVTGPVSKEAIATSGLPRAKKFLGHTEWLEAMDGADYSVMCFASPRLVTSLVSTHVPIAKVPKAISAEKVRLATESAVTLCRALGKKRPKVAIASLNPHAGEGELLGSEEVRAIVPGIAAAKRSSGDASLVGPIGAETAYRKAVAGVYDAVVAMYHDQATIPMKLLDFGSAVNITLGLSIVRTSVDHGTAYDIAGKGIAKVDGLAAALDVGIRLAEGRRGKKSRAS